MDISKYIRKFKAYIKISYESVKFYQLNYIIDIFECIIYIIASYHLWIAIYGDKDMIKGMTLKEMITYIIIARIVDKIYEADVANIIEDKLETGDISTYLIKPINPLLSMAMENIGKMLFQVVRLCIPLYIFSNLVFSLEKVSVTNFILFSVQIFMGYALFMVLSTFIGSIGLYTQSINGINALKNIVVLFFSGAFIPINMFPDILKKISNIFPFRGMYYEPINILLGKLDFRSSIKLIIVEVIWDLVLILLTAIIWRKGKRVLMVRGG